MRLMVLIFLLLSKPVFAFIDNGVDAKAGDFPTLAKLITFEGESPYSFCTVTMLTPEYALTAAHCLTNLHGTRLALPGDQKGFLDNKHVGIDVMGSYVSSKLVKYNNAAIEACNVSVFGKTKEQIQKIELKCDTESFKAMGLDLAFIRVLHPEDVHLSGLTKMNCSQLKTGTKVLMAGYGDDDRRLNPQNELRFGFNEIGAQDVVYGVAKNSEVASPNFGDSGGPLFKGKDTSYTYGVLSHMVDSQVFYVSFASETTQEFFRELVTSRKIPPSLKDLVKACLVK